MRMTTIPTLWSRLKYFNKYQMDRREVSYKHSCCREKESGIKCEISCTERCKPTEQVHDLLGVTLIITTETYNSLHPLKDAAGALVTSSAAANVADVEEVINIHMY